MKNRFRKIIGVVLSLMVVCSAFGLYASADANAEYEYRFALSPSTSFRLTNPAPKLNNSPVYVELDGGSAEFAVWGTNVPSDTSHGFYCTVNKLSLYEGESGNINQTVYSNRFIYAMLGVRNTGGYTRSIYGHWMPDAY